MTICQENSHLDLTRLQKDSAPVGPSKVPKTKLSPVRSAFTSGALRMSR